MQFKRIIRSRPFLISLHILGWACFLFFPFFIYRIQILHTGFFIKELIDNLFLIGIFYLNIYVLIPRYFNRKKIVLYFCSVLVLIVFVTAQQAAINYYFFKNYGHRPPLMMAMRTDKRFYNSDVTQNRFPPFHGQRFYRETVPAEAIPIREGKLVDDTTQVIAAKRAVPMMPILDAEGPTLLEYLLFPDVLRRSGFFALLMLFMSGFIKIALEWFKSEKQREELTVERLNAELKF